MFQVKVTNEKTQAVFGGIFPTEQQAQAWIAKQEATKAWGKPDRWVKDSEEDVFDALATREVNHRGDVVTEYFLEKEYVIEIQDISEKVQTEAAVISGLKAQELGNKIIAAVWALNEKKKIDGPKFLQMMQDQDLQQIERLLRNGALKTAKAFIQGLNKESFFTPEEKQMILEMLKEA